MRKGFFMRLALTGVRKNRKIYYPYILTAILTVAMLYIICSLSTNPELSSDTLAFTLQLGVVVTTVFSVIFLFYTNSFLMKRRKKEFGLYNILGMEKRHIGRVVLWETVLILLISLLVGFGFGLLLDRLMFMILTRMLDEAASISFAFSSYAMAYTGIVISGVFLLIFLNSLRQIHLAKPIELLRGGEVGEREPKAKWLLALLGVLTLGAGYWISVSVTNAVASIMLFFVAVMLVIAGTYLLFTAGSITALKLLRKNKKYYYRADHFISVSGMIYRMKQNAVGLSNVCILSTMVLVMVFSTVSLWFGLKDTLDTRIPQDISIDTRNYQASDALWSAVEEEGRDAGLTLSNKLSYVCLSFAGYKQGAEYQIGTTFGDEIFGNNLTALYIIPLDIYNAAFGQSETLYADELLLSSYRGAHPEDTLRLFDMDFKIKKRIDADFSNGLAAASVYNVQYLIVPDMETLSALDAKQQEAYGRHASHIEYHVSFDLPGSSHEQQLALHRSLKNRIPGISEDFAQGGNRIESRAELSDSLLELYGGLLFIGLFLGSLFIMAMILIVYYKQISEGYEDRQRYQIMQKVGLSRLEIKRSIGSQILIVFFLPLLVAGIHVAFSFPSLTRMFSALGMMNVSLMVVCALASFAAFAAMYGVVYLLTARVYYRIVSQ